MTHGSFERGNAARAIGEPHFLSEKQGREPGDPAMERRAEHQGREEVRVVGRATRVVESRHDPDNREILDELRGRFGAPEKLGRVEYRQPKVIARTEVRSAGLRLVDDHLV